MDEHAPYHACPVAWSHGHGPRFDGPCLPHLRRNQLWSSPAGSSAAAIFNYHHLSMEGCSSFLARARYRCRHAPARFVGLQLRLANLFFGFRAWLSVSTGSAYDVRNWQWKGSWIPAYLLQVIHHSQVIHAWRQWQAADGI